MRAFTANLMASLNLDSLRSRLKIVKPYPDESQMTEYSLGRLELDRWPYMWRFLVRKKDEEPGATDSRGHVELTLGTLRYGKMNGSFELGFRILGVNFSANRGPADCPGDECACC